MAKTVFLVDLFGLLLAVAGFNIAFRQDAVRRLWNRRYGTRKRQTLAPLAPDSPVGYALRISGMMLFAFGLVLAAFFTIVHQNL